MNVEQLTQADIARLRAEFREQKTVARGLQDAPPENPQHDRR